MVWKDFKPRLKRLKEMRQRQTELTVLDAQAERNTLRCIRTPARRKNVYVDADADADVQMYRPPFEATINTYVFTRDHTNHSIQAPTHTL